MKSTAGIATSSTYKTMLSSGLDSLNAEAAKGILRIKFNKRQLGRVQILSELARRDSLTREQRSELEGFLQLGSLLTMMHSKARVAIEQASTRPRRKSA
jgi:hypothetical protein